jgi:putative MFS transporter
LDIPHALLTGTLFFLGMLIGAFVFGRLADRFGRRPIFFLTLGIDACFGMASAFAPDFGILMALRFLTGLGVGGTLPIDYSMMAEFLPSDRRGRWLVYLEGFWAVGTVALAVLSYIADTTSDEAWRTIFFLIAFPAIVGLALRIGIPESPFYLLHANRPEEARLVVKQVADANGRSVDIQALAAETTNADKSVSLFSPSLRRRSVLIFLAWLAISVSYYGIFVYLPIRLSSHGAGFMKGQSFLILVAAAQIPGYALAAYGLDRWGRKPTLMGFLALSAAGCLLYTAGQSSYLVFGATLLTSFALLGTWGALYAFTPEIYPTTLRASGMGTAGASARFGGLLAPSLVAPIMSTNFEACIATLAALLLVSAIFIFLIDVETRNRPLT